VAPGVVEADVAGDAKPDTMAPPEPAATFAATFAAIFTPKPPGLALPAN
jgi:hypothetical protein